MSTTDGLELEQVQRWAARHGNETALRLLEAERVADAIREMAQSANTNRTYDNGHDAWARFCAAHQLPPSEPTRGTLATYAAWLLTNGRKTPGPGGATGYAKTSAIAYLTGAIVRLRDQGCEISKKTAAEAYEALEAAHTKMVKDGVRVKGRGQAQHIDPAALEQIVRATDTTPTGLRDRALILMGWNLAARASELAGLLADDVDLTTRGMKVHILAGKTTHSVRSPAIAADPTDPALCPVRAWTDWRQALALAEPERSAATGAPAFHAIDRWGNIGGGMSPQAVTNAIGRAADRAGIPVRVTEHSLRAGLATAARDAGGDSLVIAEQGGWAKNSTAMLGYMRRADEYTDNAATLVRRAAQQRRAQNDGQPL
ncbi:tyrosine-type recombinase/integrase [Streptomyces sp. NBC_00012]|uniref:tyrosine-type recombinase/integrase n=1 Tax=Streptomyces sp. NBC_00012 TaxID=2975621 RepID=UPI0032443789